MAVRTPSPEALAIMQGNVSRIVKVSDAEVLAAVKIYFSDTHNIAEGAGAAPLAAAMQEAEINRGQSIAVVLSGGNIDSGLFIRALS
jgi:threonine dehydratase